MSRISAEYYLNEAVERVGPFVSECVNVDLRKATDEYYLRAIFPCRIYAGGTKVRQIYDLPYLEHCKFTYVVVERYIKAQNVKHYEKIRKCLVQSKDFQVKVGRQFQKELLCSLRGESDEDDWTYALADVITDCAKLKGGQPSVYASYRAQAVEFNFKTERTTQLTSSGMMYCIPSKQYLKRISKKLHNDYLRYFLDQDSMQKGVPRPKGWMKNNITPFYCGIEDLRQERLDVPIKWEKENSPLSLEEIKDILSLVPYPISIPLFSFTVFSVLKFFYPEYPSRMSVHDTYESVIRKVKKVMYFSLEGKNRELAQETAELYCGSFLRHSLGGTPARHNESKYVHDGITIYSENVKRKYRISEKNINSYLVMDACALFVNIQLPEDKASIKIKWDEVFCGTSASVLRGYRNKVDLLICHFIAWVEDYIQNKMSKYAENERQKYEGVVSELGFDGEYHFLQGAVDRGMKTFIDQALNASKKKLDHFSISPAEKKNYVYLLSAFYIFTFYLLTSYDEAELDHINKIKAIGVDTLSSLCRGTVSTDSMMRIFSRYMSYLFEMNAIIPIRGKATGSVSGWLDPKQNAVLLPYRSYYDEFQSFCKKARFDRAPSSKKEFQSTFLAASGFIQLRQNGKNSSYSRADCVVEVGPVGKPRKENVIRISLAPFQEAPLSKQAIEVMRSLSAQKIKRRAPNKRRESE